MLMAIASLGALFAAPPVPAPAGAGDGGALAGIMAMMGTIIVVFLVIFAFFVVVMWKIFTKAGQPGWAAIVPFYNTYVLICQVCELEIIWFIMTFIPCVYVVPALYVPFKLAEKFGKEAIFAVGMLFLPFIFYPILAFGSAEYKGGAGGGKKRRRDDDDEEEEEEEEEDEE